MLPSAPKAFRMLVDDRGAFKVSLSHVTIPIFLEGGRHHNTNIKKTVFEDDGCYWQLVLHSLITFQAAKHLGKTFSQPKVFYIDLTPSLMNIYVPILCIYLSIF